MRKGLKNTLTHIMCKQFCLQHLSLQSKMLLPQFKILALSALCFLAFSLPFCYKAERIKSINTKQSYQKQVKSYFKILLKHLLNPLTLQSTFRKCYIMGKYINYTQYIIIKSRIRTSNITSYCYDRCVIKYFYEELNSFEACNCHSRTSVIPYHLKEYKKQRFTRKIKNILIHVT